VRVSLFRCVRVCSSTCLWSLPISTAPVGVGHPVVRAAKDDRPILAHAPFVSLLKSLYLSGTPASVPRMFSEMLSPYQVTSYPCQRTKVTHVKVARVPFIITYRTQDLPHASPGNGGRSVFQLPYAASEWFQGE
jgi:hypothetical protein